MSLLEKIKLGRGRFEQHTKGLGQNQLVRASEFNVIVDYLNERKSDNATNVATLTAGAGTINSVYGTITTQDLTTIAGGVESFTITNSACTVNSMVLTVISDYGGTGVPIIYKVVPSAGSFVITVSNQSAAPLDEPITIKFLII